MRVASLILALVIVCFVSMNHATAGVFFNRRAAASCSGAAPAAACAPAATVAAPACAPAATAACSGTATRTVTRQRIFVKRAGGC